MRTSFSKFRGDSNCFLSASLTASARLGRRELGVAWSAALPEIPRGLELADQAAEACRQAGCRPDSILGANRLPQAQILI